jgi:hypothetical protein
MAVMRMIYSVFAIDEVDHGGDIRHTIINENF